jgi:biotin carboxyl carrier protein
MEHTLRAPFDGLVADLVHGLGDQVSEGDLLLRIARRP